MASFRDPARTFQPTEVIERLLEISELLGHRPALFISSSDDLATYLDSLGFDIYSLTIDTSQAFNSESRSVLILPNGSRSHDSLTTH
ncbi:MAG TPA: hypothetical protein VKM94_22470 [Blastocatellia bacterium]|nr:hypothetical protein [Blastocatellia bacterium]